MNRIRLTVVALLATLALAACGSEDRAVPVTPTALPVNPTQAAPVGNCPEGTTEEIYVQRMYECPDGTRIYTFASDQARDDYLKAATYFGVELVEQGQGWARTRL